MADSGRLIQRIVLGVDGSRHSAAAVDWAASMARGMGAEVVAVYVIENPMDPDQDERPAPAIRYDPEWRQAMEVAFEHEWCAPLQEAGLAYRTMVEEGRPAEAITRVANDVGADVVVLGRHGRLDADSHDLGSVSYDVLHHCRRPVLLISD